ncbi:MAG: cell division protein SepF [Acidimicrobiia bacterium]|nr:MAG: cell division protein SepF [Acidimicrobiia bacterium]
MASLWNKTLFYLGLVDEEEQGVEVPDPAGDVRPVVSPTQPVEPYESATASVRPPGSGISGRRVEPPASTRRQMSDDKTHAEAGVYIHPNAGSMSTAEVPARRMEPESQIIVARNFSDAQTLADAIGSGRTVVLDLRNAEPEMVRRIVDFASGLTYALDGKMSKTAQGVILVTPSGSSLGVGEQERLTRLGLFGTSA